MYRGHYDRQTPPGYSGIAFREKIEDKKENSPTPVENGAGEMKGQEVKNEILRPPSASVSADRRNEVKALPRDFSGVMKTFSEEQASESKEAEAFFKNLSSFMEKKFSLEELLLLGTALLLATREEKSEAFPVFALALTLLAT